MAVPGFQSFLRPVLDQYADGAGVRARHLSDVVASRLQLSAADLEETILSGEPRLVSRLCWAHSGSMRTTCPRNERARSLGDLRLPSQIT